MNKKTIIALDVGGSKIHLGIFEGDSLTQQVLLIKEQKYLWKEVKNIKKVLELTLNQYNIHPIDIISIGIAGPVDGSKSQINITNLGIQIDLNQLKTIMHSNNIFVINDLVAHGYGIISQSHDDMYENINIGINKNGNKALIAAGTGLGESILFYNGTTHIPFATEGGHCSFAPTNDLEISLLQYAKSKFNSHVSVERLVSGAFGLPTIFEFLCKHYNYNSQILQKIKIAEDPAPVIYEEAENGDELAIRSIQLFLKLYAQEASNLALKSFAIGGVYLGGGIINKLIKYINTQEFIKAFCDKGRFKELLAQIPIKIIKDQNNAIKGAAFYGLIKS